MKILKFFAIALVAWMETAQAEDVIEQPLDQMILIPTGDFTNGLSLSNEKIWIRECRNAKYKEKTCKEKLIQFKDSVVDVAAKQVFVESFYIDQYEVSVEDYIQCMKAGVCSIPSLKGFLCPVHSSYDLYKIDPISYARHPINCVSAEDAEIFCHWKNKRLPTVTEWRKAARGVADDRMFPWGYGSPSCDLAAIQLYRPECLWFPGGDKAVCDRLDISHPCHATERLFESLWPVDAKPLGVSPYGVFQMVGNVSEWVTSHDKSGQVIYHTQGGSFASEFDANVLRSYQSSKDHGGFQNGIRCARSAE